MRRIIFNEETIEQIRDFINSGHTLEETCNKFTIKYDTLKRVMYENNIEASRQSKSTNKRELVDEDTVLICKLFSTTHMSMKDIVKETKLEYHVVLDVIKQYFSDEYISKRHAKIYSKSKLGDKNGCTRRSGSEHHNYKGLVDDGDGYYMILKPDWYTGRVGSSHVFYHSVVMCEHLGLTEIPKGFVIHHIDGNRHNNDISNLALMTSGGHSKLHSLMKNLCKVQRLSKNGVGDNKAETSDIDRLNEVNEDIVQ